MYRTPVFTNLGAPRLTVVPVGRSLGWGVATGNGKLAAVTSEFADENYLLVWNSPSDLATFASIDLGVSNKRLSALAWDPVNSCWYAGVVKGSSAATIYKITEPGHVVTIHVNNVALPGSLSNWQLVPSGGLSTDGTSIFLNVNQTGNPSNVYAFDCATGALTASLGLTDAPNAWEGFGSAVYDSTHVVWSGVFGNLVKTTKDLTTQNANVWTDSVVGASIVQSNTILVIGTNVWALGGASGTNMKLYKWDGALSSSTIYDLGFLVEGNGWTSGAISYDGAFIWGIGTSSGKVFKFDPVAGTVAFVRDDNLAAQLVGGDDFMAVYAIGGGYVAVSGDAFSGNSRVFKVLV